MLRAKIQKLGQKIADLGYETNFDADTRRDPNKHHELQQTLIKVGNAIEDFGGPEAVNAFNKAYFNIRGSLQIAHEEAAKKIRGRNRR